MFRLGNSNNLLETIYANPDAWNNKDYSNQQYVLADCVHLIGYSANHWNGDKAKTKEANGWFTAKSP